MTNDRRLIEDFIPIREISLEAAREKSIRKGHISTLHLWWARRPLVAARAAVFASLVAAPETPQKRLHPLILVTYSFLECLKSRDTIEWYR